MVMTMTLGNLGSCSVRNGVLIPQSEYPSELVERSGGSPVDLRKVEVERAEDYLEGVYVCLGEDAAMIRKRK